MSLNSIISLGGRNVKPATERFLETKAQMEQSRANQQAMYMNQEKMGMLRQQEERSQQQYKIKTLGGMAAGLYKIKDPVKRKEQAALYAPQITKMGIPLEGEVPTDDESLLSVMTQAGIDPAETFSTKQTQTGRYYQKSSTGGADKPSPRNEAAKGQTFNIGQKEDSKFTYKELGNAVDNARFANQEKKNIGYIRAAMDGIETGSLTDVKMSVNRLASSLNLPVSNDMANLESANTAMGNLVMAGLNNFPGQISNEERKFVATIMPKLTQTSKGREQIIEFLGRLSDRRMEYRENMIKYVGNNGSLIGQDGSFYEEWDKYEKDNPVIKGLDLLNSDNLQKVEYKEIRTLPDGRKIGLKADGTKEIIQ